MSPPRISKSSIALSSLRKRLADGTWPVGTRLPGEHELATELGVGRNTLREALRSLVNQGLLSARAGDGTYVLATDELAAALARRVSHEETRQSLEVRAALEIQAARLAAERITDTDLAHLSTLTEQRRQAALSEDDQAFVRADLAWHECIIAACDNPLLSELYEGLDRAAAYTREQVPPSATAARPPRLHRPAADMTAAHDDLMNALHHHDAEAAVRAASALADISAHQLKEAHQ